MAAKKKPRAVVSAEVFEGAPVSVQEALDAIDVLQTSHPHASLLDQSALSSISGYIDSGSLSLNAIISGSTRKGIPSGRIVGYAGPSACGKTVMLCNFIRNAQKLGRVAVVFDSEIAFDLQTAVNLGCNPKMIKHIPVDSLESWRDAMVKTLDPIIKNPALRGRFVFCLDSLGNLPSLKELEDAEKGHNAADMGLRAKVGKSIFRVITYKLAVADVPLVFTNHLYDDPGAMFESVKKNQAGGKGPEYMSSALVQFGSKVTKDQKDGGGAAPALAKEVTGGAINGIEMSALTVKNRLIPAYQHTTLRLSFTEGFDPYEGLLDMCKALNVVEMNGARVTFQGENLGFASQFADNVDVWEQKLIPALDAALESKLAFSSVLDTEEEDEEDEQPEPEATA